MRIGCCFTTYHDKYGAAACSPDVGLSIEGSSQGLLWGMSPAFTWGKYMCGEGIVLWHRHRMLRQAGERAVKNWQPYTPDKTGIIFSSVFPSSVLGIGSNNTLAHKKIHSCLFKSTMFRTSDRDSLKESTCYKCNVL